MQRVQSPLPQLGPTRRQTRLRYDARLAKDLAADGPEGAARLLGVERVAGEAQRGSASRHHWRRASTLAKAACLEHGGIVDADASTSH